MGSAALKTDGTLWLYGINSYGQLGTNDAVARSSPIQVGSDTTWSKINNCVTSFIAIKTS